MPRILYILWCAMLSIVLADSDMLSEDTGSIANGTTNATDMIDVNGTSNGIYRYLDTNLPIDEKACKEKCLAKCCPGTRILLVFNGSVSCEDNVFGVKKLKDMKMDIYTKDVKKMVKTDQTLEKLRLVYSEKFTESYPIEETDNLYFLETGEVVYRSPNYLKQWSPPASYNDFCVEVQVLASIDKVVSPGSEKIVYRMVYGEYVVDEAAESKDAITAGAMLVSCFFLLLVLAVYSVLPQKRNLPSLMLMAYVSCLFTGFLFTAVQIFTKNNLEKSECIAIGLIVYYTLLASFTWMNVMSYDMWSTACKCQSPRWEPRRKILTKFCWYSLYGFGAPLLTTLFLVGIDYADLTSVPDFIKPHYVFGDPNTCNFESDDERRIYVHGPILVTTVINIVFFVMTAVYIWRTAVRSGGNGDSRNTKKNQSRFLIYLKLILIMGVTWILDVMGAVISPESWVWYLPDVFNALIGLFIFLIFICKKDMILQLCKRFSIQTKFTRQWGESTMDTSVSVTKRQLSDKEAGSNCTIPDGFSEKPTVSAHNSTGCWRRQRARVWRPHVTSTVDFNVRPRF